LTIWRRFERNAYKMLTVFFGKLSEKSFTALIFMVVY